VKEKDKMKKLMFLLVLLFVGVVAFGFFRGWLQLSTSSTDNQPSATITVDKDKIHQDEQKTKDTMQNFGHDAKEKIGDRTGKVQEPERRR
jgi:hypothetical protein